MRDSLRLVRRYLTRRVYSTYADRGEARLPRLVSLTFPDGKAGLGLLLLRAAVGSTTAAQGVVFLSDRYDSTLLVWAVGLTAILSGASLLAGLLTPVACVLVLLGGAGVALSWLPSPNLFEARLSLFFLIITAAALAFTGPGAFSLDARLFGRREIIIPHAKTLND